MLLMSQRNVGIHIWGTACGKSVNFKGSGIRVKTESMRPLQLTADPALSRLKKGFRGPCTISPAIQFLLASIYHLSGFETFDIILLQLQHLFLLHK
jgi:hypothetical protein